MTERVALVTGASSGIGASTAIELAERGYTVYAAARRVERMETLKTAGIRVIPLDVTDDDSVMAAVSGILDTTGRIDLLVNNAGYGSFGAIEEVSPEEGRKQFDVNVFGAIRLAQLVIPGMRERRTGRIVNVTSVGGKIHSPFGAWYHGTKFALEGMSDALRVELEPFGVDVVVVEPGAIKTEWSGIAADTLLAASGDGPYAEAAAKLAESFHSSTYTDSASDPAVIAAVIVRAATVDRPRPRYAAGSGAKLLLTARRMLSDRAFDKLVTRSVR
ncbi:oxidoreductase [Frondihabitans australicus]|uniref:Short-subunit dehydrogenase n=1 Tax=Frondihabitans australicus TaxID=386892 RepID=A0A495IIH8_9MICO|nr:oxidoreductase [Frondihabitans australicus]RKR75794.1 short-subunit dehydrogenase [Frondihabitans australicus]